jgi:predicted nucleotidyltransferase
VTDWESWLRAAAHPPSDNEDDKRQRTEQQIRNALASYEALQGRPYAVYAKGSYANNTNVRLNYDVDIAVEYRGYFYYDLCFDLKDEPKETVGVVTSGDRYTRDEFKADIKGALVQAFGTSSIEVGKIAYRVREKKTTLPADVVPCWEYRRYDRIENGSPVFQEGSCVFPTGGSRTPNYPAQQLSRGIAKNNATSRRYKRMVRALKRLQTYLVENEKLTTELPSYLIECLVFNVDSTSFGNSTYMADMRAVLAAIFNATLPSGDSADWEEVNGLNYLFRGQSPWTVAGVHKLADAAWNELGFE